MMTAKALLNHANSERDVTAGYTILPMRFIAEAVQIVEDAILRKAVDPLLVSE